MLAPAHVHAAGKLLRQREVVEPLDVHRHDQQVVQVVAGHHLGQRGMPAAEFRIGETGIFLRENLAKAWVKR